MRSSWVKWRVLLCLGNADSVKKERVRGDRCLIQKFSVLLFLRISSLDATDELGSGLDVGQAVIHEKIRNDGDDDGGVPRACVEVRGQLAEICPLLSPCGAPGATSGHQADGRLSRPTGACLFLTEGLPPYPG